MKFWQKAYALTLALFAVCMAGGLALVLALSEQRSYEAECGMLLAKQHNIAQSFAADAAAVALRRPAALPDLAKTYVRQYASDEVFLQITCEDALLAGTLPVPDSPLPAAMSVGQRVHAVRTAQGNRYLYVLAQMPSPANTVLICAFDMQPYFDGWKISRSVCVLVGACVLVVLAAMLYFVLRGLSRPMERLAAVAQQLAKGEYTARSGVKGHDEVAQLGAALDEMASCVQQSMADMQAAAEEKQNLVDTLAHELRTPLTAVGGYADYLCRAELNEEEKQEAAHYIIDEAHRLATMSDRLLHMAALRGEQAVLRPVDVPTLLAKVRCTLLPKAVQSGVQLLPVQAQPCKIAGEAALLESLLINLGDNAIKACRQGDSVALLAQCKNGTVTLMVQDTGRGMETQTLAQLGKAFYRPDKARSREQGGAGLGVALCRQIAQSHGTTLQYKSRLGVGTTAMVTFTTL